MSTLTTLEQLEELTVMRDLLAMDKAAQRKQIIPSDVQAELEALDSEFSDKEDMANQKIEELTAKAKEESLKSGDSIEGKYLIVVYNPGGKSASAKDVMQLADRWEKTDPNVAAEIRSIITMKKPSASVQPRKGH